MECSKCSSSDANAVYSDGSTYCFSCKASTQAGSKDTAVEFNVVQTQLSLEEIALLSIEPIRNISKKVLYDAGVKVEYDQNRNVISHFYPITINKKVKAYKKRIVATKNFRVVGKAEVPELFNQVNCGRYKNLVITEGEIDCLSILEMLTKAKAKFDVVSIVNGAQSARRNIASNLDFVNKYDKVFLAFDNDEPGIEAANDVAHIIKPGKAHIVNSMHKDANEALCKAQSEPYLSSIWGSRVYKPDNFVSGEKIWDAFKERSTVKSVPYPACLKGLNDKLFGMRLGEITLFTSGTGSGKSTVVKETILNLLDNTKDKVGLISLEESIGDTATKLIGMSINKNIRMPEDVTEEEARKGYEKVFGDERLILLDHQGSVADTSLLDRIEYLAALGCNYLILDHITIAVSEGVDGATGNEAVDKVMSSLLKIVKRYNIHLTLISHLRKSSGEGKSFEEGIMPNLDSIKGSGSIKQISFDIIGFARNMMAIEKSDRNIVKFAVLKSRFSGDTGICGQATYNVDTGRLNYNESNLAFKEVL
ncbi:AAA protein [Pelagibacter phage Kolga EXVC016S]|nr:AAA protein [Pelagibacter phage Kolga EXVC016S]